MINNATWEQIFSADTPYNMQLLIEVSDGSYLTNTEISSESMSVTEQFSDSNELVFGGCNAASFKLRIRSSVENLTGKHIKARLYAFNTWDCYLKVIGGTPVLYYPADGSTEALDPDESFVIGEYDVMTDRPCPDKKYRDITAYDVMEKIISADISDWYDNLYNTYTTVTLKNLRQNLLNHFGISYDPSFTGVNDSIAVGKNIYARPLSGKMLLSNICELNGCFGYISRDNIFKCKVLDSTSVNKTYYRYLQGQVDYQDAIANVITQLKVVNEDNQATATIGVAGNTYIINDNELLRGLDSNTLNTVATNLLPVISVTAYRPFNCKTYGDPCVELGDFINIPTEDKTIDAFLLYRELTGTQAMRDMLVAKGEEKNSSKANGNAAVVSRLNSSMSVMTEKNTLQYYLFRTATDLYFNDGADPVKIATLNYVSTDETTVNIMHEFKLDCDISTGSDRIKAYVTYYHDDELITYQPIETWNLDDYHMLDLQYALTETEPQSHKWEVYLNVVGGDAVMYAGDGSITLHGQNLITDESWGGDIEVDDDTYYLVIGGDMVFDYEDSVSVDEYKDQKHEERTVSDSSYTLTLGGSMTFNYVETDINVITRQGVYRRVTEDGKTRITEDGKTRVTEGGNE